jgi:hypothetical protein
MSAYAAGMADGDTTLLAEHAEAGPAPSAGLIAAVSSFATAHGGAEAVVEYVGRRGARIVLVGHDGTWGDQFASGTDVARRACAAAGVPVDNGWERELIETMRPDHQRWRQMGRRRLARWARR